MRKRSKKELKINKPYYQSKLKKNLYGNCKKQQIPLKSNTEKINNFKKYKQKKNSDENTKNEINSFNTNINQKMDILMGKNELDYLNFSKIDVSEFRPNFSFEANFFPKDRIVSNRYNNSESSKDTLITEKNTDKNTENSLKNIEKINKTPSSICNYYDKNDYSSTKKNMKDNFEIKCDNMQLKKNLSQLYENNNKNLMNLRLKDFAQITKKKNSSFNYKKSKTNVNNKSNLNSKLVKTRNKTKKKKKSIEIENLKNNAINKIKDNKQEYKNRLMKNYLNNQIKKNSFTSNKNLFNNSNNPKKIVENLHNKTNNTSNGIYYINVTGNSGKNYTNSKSDHKRITQQNKKQNLQKPLMLCYDQIKYDAYFVTPKTINKSTKKKIRTSNKNKKLNNTSDISISNINNNTNNNVSTNIINNNNIVIKNFFRNKSKSFKTINIINNKKRKNNCQKNQTNKNKNNLLHHIKSTSYLINPKGIINKYIDISNHKKKDSKKNNSEILNGLLKNKKSQNNSTSKNKKNNTLKISKTLTEKNIFQLLQATPEYYKIKKRNVSHHKFSRKKHANNTSNPINKYNNSNFKKKLNSDYNMYIINLFKHKTQSDFKANKYYINSSNKYTGGRNNEEIQSNVIDKNVKQKLLDRMNNTAKNNWHYILKNNKDTQKVLLKNLSELMKTPGKEEYLQNNTIISNESERKPDNENES